MWGSKKSALALLLAVMPAGIAFAQTASRPSGRPPKPAAVQTQPEASQVAVPASPQTPEQMPPQPPEVTYRNGMLTIVARNSTLADVMSAVRAQTGATVETPQNAVSERVMSRLGPAPPQEVLAALLNGSRFDFVILGNPSGGLQHVILTQRTGGADEGAPSSVNARNAGARSNSRRPPVEEVEEAPEEPEMEESPEEAPDDSREVPEEVPPMPVQNPAQNPNLPPGAVQPGQQPSGQQTTPAQPVPGQPQIKTPEQLLEDLRRLQQQQQQQQQQNPPAPAPE